MCDFRNLNDGNYYWSRTRAELTSVISKPLIDHSTQMAKGHYLLLIPSADTFEGDNAFVAINLKESNSLCEMRFWYWISDSYVGSINVYYRKVIGSNMVLLQNFKSDLTNTWTRGSVPISSSSDPLQVKSIPINKVTCGI
jgi:hypothetical protein